MSKNSTTTGENTGLTPRALTLDEMRRMFDETAEGNEERRRAIVECMTLIGEKGYQQACSESATRTEQQDSQGSV